MSNVDFPQEGDPYQPPDVNNDPGVLNDPGTGGSFGVTDPSARSGVNQSAYDSVSGYYRSYLGRDPENQDVLASWVNGLGGGGSNLAAVEAAIKGSTEAQGYASRAQSAVPAAQAGFQRGGNLRDPGYAAQFVNYYAGQPGMNPSLARDPNYWIQKIVSGELGDENSIVNYFMRPEGAPAGSSAAGGYLASGANPGGYTDPSSQLYLSQLLQRLQQVQQPQDHSVYDLLKSLALQVSGKLQQDPYSAADEQALITKYRQPLTQARDSAYQRNKEQASRHGYLPSSGLLRSMDSKVDQAYEGGIAQGANQMGVDAVHQKQANMLQALQVLSGLSAANDHQVDRQNAMSDQAVNLAKMFPDFDSQRLDQLLRASGDTSSSSALNSLMSLGNMNLNTQSLNNASGQANSEAWGKIIATILAGL